MHGRNTADRNFRNNLGSCIEHLGFKACLAGPNVWTYKEIKSDGQEYYVHALICTYADLVVSDEADYVVRNQIGKCFVANKESIGSPDRNLGRSVRKVLLYNMAESWVFENKN